MSAPSRWGPPLLLHSFQRRGEANRNPFAILLHNQFAHRHIAFEMVNPKPQIRTRDDYWRFGADIRHRLSPNDDRNERHDESIKPITRICLLIQLSGGDTRYLRIAARIRGIARATSM